MKISAVSWRKDKDEWKFTAIPLEHEREALLSMRIVTSTPEEITGYVETGREGWAKKEMIEIRLNRLKQKHHFLQTQIEELSQLLT